VRGLLHQAFRLSKRTCGLERVIAGLAVTISRSKLAAQWQRIHFNTQAGTAWSRRLVASLRQKLMVGPVGFEPTTKGL
jgi:hypothetical protein